MRLGLLGPLEVRDGGGAVGPLGGRRQRTMLAALGLQADRPVSVERLVEDVWEPDELPADPARTLSTIASRLRSVLGDTSLLVAEGAGYRLALPAEQVDVVRLEAGLEQGRAARLAGEPEQARTLLGEALELWRGEPLADLGEAPLCRWARPRLMELQLQALEERNEVELALGQAGRLIGELLDLVAQQPLRERLVGHLMRALAATGRPGEALEVYEHTRTRLGEELGIDPSKELAELHVAILRGESETPPGPATDAAQAAGVQRPPQPLQIPLARLGPDEGPFVGRTEVLERLRATWTTVIDQASSQAVLLVGEPGVGKTRTVAETAREVFDKGGLVLAGRCDEVVAAPYQPFVEALDWQTRHDPDLPLGRLPGELVRLLPDLDRRVSDLPAPVASEAQVEQHRLFEAVTSWLAEVSTRHGLLLIIDDLHWAPPPTLHLLTHVLRGVATHPGARLLLLSTHRDTDVDTAHPLRAALAQLHRIAPVDTLRLAGLSLDEVRSLIEHATGDDLDQATDQLADTIRTETHGNPFFVSELLHHLLDTGALRLTDGHWRLAPQSPLQVPAGVRDVVTHRLARLDEGTRQLLRTAAVIGHETDLALLIHLTADDTDVVLDALDEAITARLLTETSHNQLAFTHALVRSTLLDTLTDPRRRQLHAHITDGLETLRPHEVTTLAHHALQAAPFDGHHQRAITYAVAAGNHALVLHAPSDARRWFDHALELIHHTAPHTETRTHLEALYGLGRAQRDQGDPAFRDTLLHTTRQALRHGHTDLAAHATIANTRLTISLVGAVDEERVELIEEVLAVIDDEDAASRAARAQLTALLASELTFDPGHVTRRLQLADEAVELCRADEGPDLEAWALTTTAMAVVVPERMPGLPQRTARATRAAERTEDPALLAMSHYNQAQALLGVGDIGSARRHAQQAARFATEGANPVIQWMTQTLTVQFTAYQGDLDGARQQNAECLARGQQHGQPDAEVWWGGIESILAVVDGSNPGLVDPLAEFADAHGDMPVWRAGQALALAQGGCIDEARDLLARHRITGPDVLPHDWLRLTGLGVLALVAFEIEDADLGAALLPATEPHRHQWAHIALFCIFPAELAIGLAAAAADDLDEAVSATREGRDLLARQGLVSHHPLASLLLSRMLTKRGDALGRKEAHGVAADGLAAAETMGMDAMVGRLQTHLERLS